MTIGLFSCGQSSQDKKSVTDKQDKVETKALSLPTIGEKIQGDFNGDEHTEIATAAKIKEGQGKETYTGNTRRFEYAFPCQPIPNGVSGRPWLYLYTQSLFGQWFWLGHSSTLCE